MTILNCWKLVKCHESTNKHRQTKRHQKEVAKEMQKRYSELQGEIMQDITEQIMATVLWTLDKWYGWKGKRLRAFINAVNSTFDIMDTAEFDNDNNASYLKETYGIDLSELISTEMTDRVQKGG